MPADSTYMVIVTFDLHGAPTSVYAQIKNDLGKMTLKKSMRMKTAIGRLRLKLPANVFVARVSTGFAPDTKTLRFQVRAAVKSVLHSRKQAAAIIETWRRHYNEVRPHSSLGYLTPTEFRAKHVTNTNQIGAAVL